VGNRSAALFLNDGAGTQTIMLAGVGVAPSASALPSPVAFGNQQRGTTSASQIVTLTNTGIGSLTFTSAAITGVNANNFAQSNNCPVAPATLPVNGTCTISVTFKPNAVGSRTATLNLNDAAGIQTITLTGAGVAPSASVLPSPVAFGNQQRGTTSASQTVTLTNTGIGPLSFTSATIGGVNPFNFVQSNNCPAVLDPVSLVGGTNSCAINVTFTPSVVGNRSAALFLNDGAGTQTIMLAGSGTP
jgi:hypothetical protein